MGEGGGGHVVVPPERKFLDSQFFYQWLIGRSQRLREIVNVGDCDLIFLMAMQADF